MFKKIDELIDIHNLKHEIKENMTLDEAIQHCEEKALCGDACGLEHKQLAEWLKELKYYRKQKQKAMNQWALS